MERPLVSSREEIQIPLAKSNMQTGTLRHSLVKKEQQKITSPADTEDSLLTSLTYTSVLVFLSCALSCVNRGLQKDKLVSASILQLFCP